MSLYASFHGGTLANSINNILQVSGSGPGPPILGPASSGAMPALNELRGFTTDPNGSLYVLNAYKDFNQILLFEKQTGSGRWTFAACFVDGKDSQLAHPFCAVFGTDGDLYVTNQDPDGQKHPSITRYEGPGKKHPGKLKGVFASGFEKLRGMATDGRYWYVADAGGGGSGAIYIYDDTGNKQANSLAVNEPVHLLYASPYLYIGSEKDNGVYRYDTKEGKGPEPFVSSTPAAPINATSGLAISGSTLFVGSRLGNSINQYPIANPKSGSVLVKGLADNPEFLVVL